MRSYFPLCFANKYFIAHAGLSHQPVRVNELFLLLLFSAMHPSALTSIFYLFNESMYQTVLSVEGKGQREHWYWWQQVDLAGEDRREWPALCFPLGACCKRAEHVLFLHGC